MKIIFILLGAILLGSCSQKSPGTVYVNCDTSMYAMDGDIRYSNLGPRCFIDSLKAAGWIVKVHPCPEPTPDSVIITLDSAGEQVGIAYRHHSRDTVVFDGPGTIEKCQFQFKDSVKN